MVQIVKSSCPLNCWDCCGFTVSIKNGKVISIDGDKDHPITQGKICGRGRTLADKTNSTERLLYPLKRVDGEFVRISWEQALDEIAAKMAELKNKYGSTSILHSHDYANSGLLKNLDQRFFNCFGGVTEVIGSICWGAGIEAQKWDFGNSHSHSPEDLFNSSHILIWGRNAARTNLHLFQRLQQAKKKGIPITVIDPIYNATAKIANQYFSIKPGMDGLLAAGVIKELLEQGWEDSQFIQNHSVGFEDLQSLVDSISFEAICEQAEVSRETIAYLAQLYASGPVSTFMGLGMQRYSNGGNTIRLIDALVAVSGNIGIPGGGANFGKVQVGQSFDIEAIALPERKKESRQFTMMKQAEGILNAENPSIKMIFVTCGNPALQVPDSNQVEKAFSSTQTVVVMDHFLTDTALLADYVLPSTTSFEEEDVYYSSMDHHFVNYGPQLVDPPGEAKADLWVWTQLAERLGFGEVFHFTRQEFIDMGLKPLTAYGINYESLKEAHYKELPVEKVPWQNKQFQTQSGKYEFTSALGEMKGYESKLALSLPAESKWTNSDKAEKYPYSLLTIHPLRSNHSQHYHLIDGLGRLKVEVSPDLAESLQIVEGDIVRVWNDRGEVKGSAAVLKAAHPGTINIDEGIWKRYGGSINSLTSSRESDNGMGSTVYDCLVNIEKI
ncbi:oxidoreductase [Bacillus sp. M6-12]|uniref:molybdopterin-dependent oxidoreductase n=1 Tax=Bacillus sp. M6-12 TaxID=2054166 RepID=UPI000C77CBA6|nr:molybdopterin-dependent oxidoreductase [Bacillus sp. M6-12]PLS15779.1 oxidoreductase [Bacillus sp. M6-12]